MEVQWIDCAACSTRTHTDEFEVKKGLKLKTCKRCCAKAKAYYHANKLSSVNTGRRNPDAQSAEAAKSVSISAGAPDAQSAEAAKSVSIIHGVNNASSAPNHKKW